MPRAAVRAALGLPGGPACTGAARGALLPEVRAREPVPAVPPSQVPTWLCQHRALLAATNGSEQPPSRFRAFLRAAARGRKLSQRPSAAFEARRRSRRGVAGAFCFPAGLERLQSPLVFQDAQEKEIVIPERAEEAKLKAKYPNLGQKPGGSDFLMKRLQKGQKYFDSGDYNMAKAKMKNKQLPSAGPDKNLVTGDHIPTPQDLPQRKSSLVTSKLAG
nr:alpha-endosulfine [Anser cygnoides]XP_047910286.1 alpha-endosulfine [Anser cygnoides]